MGKSNMKVKYIIIGAGAAGLSFAAALQKSGEESFIVLEKESEAGGLCRSAVCGGSPIDRGGGHFLNADNKTTLDFVFSYLPEQEWKLYERDTKIAVGGHTVSYPIEVNIWQFPQELQLNYLESIARAGDVSGEDMPEGFGDWIYWKFGAALAEAYMIPYNRKLWSCDLNSLGTYWLYKLPDVSFRETMRSCLDRAPGSKLSAHARFYYPKKTGYGEVFLRIAESIGSRLRCGYAVEKIDCDTLTVNGEFQGEYIINTAPWHEFSRSLSADMQERVDKLKYVSLDIDYHSTPSADCGSHWTYFADPALPYHRIIHRDNIIEGSKGYWTETNALRRGQPGEAHYENPYAYPLNMLDKPQVIGRILDTMRKRNIIGLGRWGEWEHMNSDVAIARAIQLAGRLNAI